MIGDYERAIPHLLKAIEVDPHSVQPYSNLGVALIGDGRRAKGRNVPRVRRLDSASQRDSGEICTWDEPVRTA